jgi:hypothetical protein
MYLRPPEVLVAFFLSGSEARRIAANIAKLPELLGQASRPVYRS